MILELEAKPAKIDQEHKRGANEFKRSPASGFYYDSGSSESKGVKKTPTRPVPQSGQKLLLTGYLNSPEVKPMHCRRTLDQFSYHMLNSTESRDKGQVAYRWARTSKPSVNAKDRPIIMVDQLWLWVLQDGECIIVQVLDMKGY